MQTGATTGMSPVLPANSTFASPLGESRTFRTLRSVSTATSGNNNPPARTLSPIPAPMISPNQPFHQMRSESETPPGTLPTLSISPRKSSNGNNSSFTIHPISCQSIPSPTNHRSLNTLTIGVPPIQGHSNVTSSGTISFARQFSPTGSLSPMERLNLQSPTGDTATRSSVNSRFPTVSVSAPLTHSPPPTALSTFDTGSTSGRKTSGSSSDNSQSSRSSRNKRPYNRVAETDKGEAYQKRREKNRQAVEKHRLEKKERDAKQQQYYQGLEAKLRQLESKFDKLQNECEALRAENAHLRAAHPSSERPQSHGFVDGLSYKL